MKTCKKNPIYQYLASTFRDNAASVSIRNQSITKLVAKLVASLLGYAVAST